MFDKLFGSPKNHPFNQALQHFQKLHNYETGSPQFVHTISEIIRLCQTAIQGNKNDGDAHVLLANAYLLGALSCSFRKGYSYFLAKAAAVIHTTRLRGMYIRNRENADKVYNGIVEQLSTQMPEWVEGIERLTNDMNQLQKRYYDTAISPLNIDEIQIMLTGE